MTPSTIPAGTNFPTAPRVLYKIVPNPATDEPITVTDAATGLHLDVTSRTFLAISDQGVTLNIPAIILPFDPAPILIISAGSDGGATGGGSTSDPRPTVYDLGTLPSTGLDLSWLADAMPPPVTEDDPAHPGATITHPTTVEVWLTTTDDVPADALTWPALPEGSAWIWLNSDSAPDLAPSTAYRFAIRRESADRYVADIAYTLDA